MLTLLLACVTMAARDAIYTWLTIAEAHGRAVLSGLLDAAGDLAAFAVTVLGAGAILQDGWSGHTVAILAVMLATSFLTTTAATWAATRQMRGSGK